MGQWVGLGSKKGGLGGLGGVGGARRYLGVICTRQPGPTSFLNKQDENFLLHDFNQQPPVHFLLITLSSQDKRDSKALDSRKSTSDPFTGADREQGTAFQLLKV